MTIDLAARAYAHNFNMDPIVRSLLDTDMYKLLMLQFIWAHDEYRDYPVTFELINRDRDMRIADYVTLDEVKEQLDHARSLSFAPSELIWLQGNTFFGKVGMFEPGFIEWLRNFKLPTYEITTVDGQFKLRSSGSWAEVTLWEIIFMLVVGELKNRKGLNKLGKLDLKIMYARALTKLYEKLIRLRDLDNLSLMDFSTRRRHNFLYQEEAVLMAADVLGGKFIGTSNVLIAMKHGFEAKGTNAHELQMVRATMADTNQELRDSQYIVPRQWRTYYGDALSILLPDTFGTTQFLMNAPDDIVTSAGIRFDSKKPIIGGEEAINWWLHRGIDPTTKLGLFSDGLDVDEIVMLYNHFNQRMRVGFGWGTLFGNDLRGCAPVEEPLLKPISLVCKVVEAGGKPAVKLSDNPAKAMGDKSEVQRYIKAFGTAGVANAPVIV
jgi:nicotinate phosphoribosyltransferase